MTTLRFGRCTVELSNPEKVLFPADGITKAELADYYLSVAEAILPHLDSRPLTMQRFPDGIGGEGFFQKEVPDHFPGWIERVTVEKEGGEITHALCRNAATLAYLAGQACITPHVWLSRADRPQIPDRMVFDLDPSGEGFEPVRAAALDLKGLLEGVGLVPYVKATGSRGLHVVVPLQRQAGFDEVRSFARRVGEMLVERDPDRLTMEQRREKRGDRVFLDVLRNAYAQTAVAPYAVRALPGAPVAAPLRWGELEGGEVGPRTFSLRDLPRRLSRVGEPWRGMGRRSRSLRGPRRRLEAL